MAEGFFVSAYKSTIFAIDRPPMGASASVLVAQTRPIDMSAYRARAKEIERTNDGHYGPALQRPFIRDPTQNELRGCMRDGMFKSEAGHRKAQAALVALPDLTEPLYRARALDVDAEACFPMPTDHYTSFRRVPPAVATMPTPPSNAASSPAAASAQHRTAPTRSSCFGLDRPSPFGH